MDKKKTMAMGMDTSKILITFFILFFFCSEDDKKEEIKIDENLEEIKKVKIVEYKEKDKIFELFSEDIVSKEKILKAKKLDIIIYDKGIKSVYIKADSGNYSENGDLELKGKVILWNYEGDTLWTSYLIYKFNEGIIRSDSECKLYKKGKYIRGKGFESKKPFKKIKIFGKVEGISK